MKWDPRDHPRDPLGKFKSLLASSPDGRKIELPDGTYVKKRSNSNFSVGNSKYPGGGNSKANDPHNAARLTLGRSAATYHSQSFGGPEHHGTIESAAAAERKKQGVEDPKSLDALAKKQGLKGTAGQMSTAEYERRLNKKANQREKAGTRKKAKGGAPSPEELANRAVKDSVRTRRKKENGRKADGLTPAQRKKKAAYEKRIKEKGSDDLSPAERRSYNKLSAKAGESKPAPKLGTDSKRKQRAAKTSQVGDTLAQGKASRKSKRPSGGIPGKEPSGGVSGKLDRERHEARKAAKRERARKRREAKRSGTDKALPKGKQKYGKYVPGSPGDQHGKLVDGLKDVHRGRKPSGTGKAPDSSRIQTVTHPNGRTTQVYKGGDKYYAESAGSLREFSSPTELKRYLNKRHRQNTKERQAKKGKGPESARPNAKTSQQKRAAAQGVLPMNTRKKGEGQKAGRIDIDAVLADAKPYFNDGGTNNSGTHGDALEHSLERRYPDATPKELQRAAKKIKQRDGLEAGQLRSALLRQSARRTDHGEAKADADRHGAVVASTGGRKGRGKAIGAAHFQGYAEEGPLHGRTGTQAHSERVKDVPGVNIRDNSTPRHREAAKKLGVKGGVLSNGKHPARARAEGKAQRVQKQTAKRGASPQARAAAKSKGSKWTPKDEKRLARLEKNRTAAKNGKRKRTPEEVQEHQRLTAKKRKAQGLDRLRDEGGATGSTTQPLSSSEQREYDKLGARANPTQAEIRRFKKLNRKRQRALENMPRAQRKRAARK